MKQQWRDQFVADLARAGVVNVDIARRLLRYAATAQRLAEAACNGDWPADNGERQTAECAECGGGWAPSSFRRGRCPDCANEARLRAYVADAMPGWGVTSAGDPRGYVVRVVTPDGREIGVPS